MRALSSTIWTLVPVSAPTLDAPCPRCDTVRSFACAHRFRVNAHKRKLDVWLLFHCPSCAHTLRRPIHERVPVRGLDPAHLDAFHHNDPAMVLRCAQRLGAHVDATVEGVVPSSPGLIHLSVPPGVRMRLDRVLALGLGVSRATVQAAWHAHHLRGVPDVRRALGRPARDGQCIVLHGPVR